MCTLLTHNFFNFDRQQIFLARYVGLLVGVVRDFSQCHYLFQNVWQITIRGSSDVPKTAKNPEESFSNFFNDTFQKF